MSCRVRCQSGSGGVYCFENEDPAVVMTDSGFGYWSGSAVTPPSVAFTLAAPASISIHLAVDVLSTLPLAGAGSLAASVTVDGQLWCEPTGAAGGNSFTVPTIFPNPTVSLAVPVLAATTLAVGAHTVDGLAVFFADQLPTLVRIRQQLLVIVGADTGASCGNGCA